MIAVASQFSQQTAPALSRPVLRYHGGKFRLASWIISHFPTHRIYCEPYGGAASVLLRKVRSYAEVYNDIDGELVNVFRILRDEAKSAELQRRLRLTPFAREEFKASYTLAGDDVDRARHVIALAFMGFGSASQNREHMTGFRGTSHRSGTTPAHDWRNYAETVNEFVERLRWVTIECCIPDQGVTSAEVGFAYGKQILVAAQIETALAMRELLEAYKADSMPALLPALLDRPELGTMKQCDHAVDVAEANANREMAAGAEG